MTLVHESQQEDAGQQAKARVTTSDAIPVSRPKAIPSNGRRSQGDGRRTAGAGRPCSARRPILSFHIGYSGSWARWAREVGICTIQSSMRSHCGLTQAAQREATRLDARATSKSSSRGCARRRGSRTQEQGRWRVGGGRARTRGPGSRCVNGNLVLPCPPIETGDG